MILRCLEKNTENMVSLEELLSILPRGRKERIVLTKKQVLLVVTALIFAIAAWKSLLPKEKEVLVAEKQSFLTETADVERVVSSPVSPGAIQVSVASAAGDNGGGCKQGGFRRGPDKYAGANTREDEKDKTETK